MNRRFSPEDIDEFWTSYVRIGEGEAHLCTVRNEWSSRILSYAVADHIRTEIVLDPLPHATPTRIGQCAGTALPADRGSQFSDRGVEDFCTRFGMIRSMGSVDEPRAGVEGYVKNDNHQRRCENSDKGSPIRYELSLASLNQAA